MVEKGARACIYNDGRGRKDGEIGRRKVSDQTLTTIQLFLSIDESLARPVVVRSENEADVPRKTGGGARWRTDG